MRTIVIAAALSLIGYTPASARHHHYRHGAHRHLTERHHHEEANHKTNLDSGTQLRDFEDPAARKGHASATDIDPEALAWATPKEHFDDRPRKMVGKIVVADRAFTFVSGGRGWSIPWGHWPITPEEVGSWGARHGAIGLNHGDDIPDPKLHRGREGVEIHAANHDATAGCVGIREHYDQLKKLVIGMIDRFGHAWLHVTPHAVAITPSKYLAPTVTIGKVVAAKDDDEPRHRRRHRRTRMASR